MLCHLGHTLAAECLSSMRSSPQGPGGPEQSSLELEAKQGGSAPRTESHLEKEGTVLGPSYLFGDGKLDSLLHH